MEPTLKEPSVFEFLDILQFLQAYYLHRKAVNPKFSYQTWSAELGVNSRAFLRLVLTGKKRLPSKLAESIAQTSFTTQSQSDYFRCLVGYSRSDTPQQREIFGQRMIQLLKEREEKSLISILRTDEFPSAKTDIYRFPQGEFCLSTEFAKRLLDLLNEIKVMCPGSSDHTKVALRIKVGNALSVKTESES